MIDVTEVIRCYPSNCHPGRVEPLGCCGGLSGALFWRISSPRGSLCLRRWPAAHPERAQLRWVHRVLRFVAPRCPFPLPVPIDTTGGTTYAEMDGHLWELTPWLDGAPLPESQWDPVTLTAATSAIAQLHLAMAAFATYEGDSLYARIGAAPGILKRHERLQEVDVHFLHHAALSVAGKGRVAAPLHLLADTIMARWESLKAGIARDLERASRLRVPLQPCLRDIWRPHVLFHGSAISGVIDFGALDVDSVAADIARFLGSFNARDPGVWRRGLAAYHAVRPLNREERLLVIAYDRSSALLSGLNWLQWLAAEGRPFPPGAAVQARLTALTRRLQALPENSEAHPAIL